MYLILVPLASFLPPIIHSAISMSHGNFDTSTWFIAVNFAFPFDTTSVLGWYIALLLITQFACVLTVLVTALFTYMFSDYLYIEALRDHFESIFKRVDSKITFNQCKSFGKMNKDMQLSLNELIIFHLKMTE